MSQNLHARARQCMLDSAMGTLAVEDSAWLTRHLAECSDCRKEQDGLSATVAVLKSATVFAPPFLAARTRAGVHSHAAQLQKSREWRTTILMELGFDIVWTTLIVGMMVGAASWFGYQGEMRWLVIGMISWLWLLPTIGVTLIMSLRKTGLAPVLANWNGWNLEGEARD